MEEPVSCASRGRPTAGGTNQQQIELNGTNANSITTVQKDSMVCEPPKQEKTYRIRTLTERECFRLMGVKEEDYQKNRFASVTEQSDPPCGRLNSDDLSNGDIRRNV